MKAKELNFPEIKRIINITDTHFGVRSNSVEWMEIQYDFFRKWFIPLLKKNYKPGDAIIHSGDVFDSRQSINLKVMNMALDIFNEISSIMPVFIICGNHDIYHKKSNDINSLKPLSYMDNVHVFEDPIKLIFNNGKTSGLLMPWKDTTEQEQEVINHNDADYLWCHTDIRGAKFNARVDVEHGMESATLSKFKRVYSGHIHYSQKFRNIRLLGSPYQMTRSDIGNVKSIWYLDLETDTEESHQNNFSPKFMKIKLEVCLERRLEFIKNLFRNNFIDVLVDSSMTTSFPFSEFLELVSSSEYRKLSYIIVTGTPDDLIDINEGEKLSKEVSLYALAEMYIDKLEYKPAILEKLKEESNRLILEALRANDETIG